tara:strand:+ start:106 stop:213 length:108 start_codon:yes stop_codon:yes gene_type:complete
MIFEIYAEEKKQKKIEEINIEKVRKFCLILFSKID